MCDLHTLVVLKITPVPSLVNKSKSSAAKSAGHPTAGREMSSSWITHRPESKKRKMKINKIIPQRARQTRERERERDCRDIVYLGLSNWASRPSEGHQANIICSSQKRLYKSFIWMLFPLNKKSSHQSRMFISGRATFISTFIFPHKHAHHFSPNFLIRAN